MSWSQICCVRCCHSSQISHQVSLSSFKSSATNGSKLESHPWTFKKKWGNVGILVASHTEHTVRHTFCLGWSLNICDNQCLCWIFSKKKNVHCRFFMTTLRPGPSQNTYCRIKSTDLPEKKMVRIRRAFILSQRQVKHTDDPWPCFTLMLNKFKVL